VFYSDYSDYSPDQIIDDKYKQIAEKILEMADTEECREKMKGILYEGGFEQFSVNLSDENYIPKYKDSPLHESKRRLHYAYLLAKNPDMFESIKKDNILLHHGTSIEALPSILKYGMNSVDESRKNGIEVSTGEEWSRYEGKRSFISFTTSLNVALTYAAYEGQELMIGMSPEALKNLDARSIHSDVVEIGIMNHIPIEHIKSFRYNPKDKVEFVRRLVGNRDINVIGAQMDDVFYHLDYNEMIEFLSNPEKNKQHESKKYTKDDMRAMSEKLKLSKLLELFGKAKDKLFSNNMKGRGEEYGADGR